MPYNLAGELEAISNEVAKHQIAALGRELTADEAEQWEIERQEERIKKYAGMSLDEYSFAKQKEIEETDNELRKIFPPEFFDLEFADDAPSQSVGNA